MKKVLYLGMVVFILVILASCIPDDTLPPTTPNAPTNLEAEVISSSEIKLTWNDNSDNEVGFKIERKTDSTDWDEIKTVEANTITYTDTELTSNTRYYYRVKAYNQGGESAYSNTVETVTNPLAPAAPTNLEAEVISSSEIKLTWNDNSDNEVGFKIERKTDSTDWDEIKTVEANTITYTDTELTSNTRYYYRVKAYNQGGESNYSNMISITTLSSEAIKWRYKITDWGISSSPAIGSASTIYVGSSSYLYAINSEGSLKWKCKTDWSISSSPAIGSDGTIYVGSNDGYLYAINPNGSEKWKYQTGDSNNPVVAIGSDGTIYVGSYDGYLYAINPNGSEKWKFQTGDSIYSSPAIDSDGTIYVGSNDGYLYAINSNGSEKWKYQLQIGSWIASSPTIGSDGTIYVGSNDGYLYAINSNGSEKWKYQTGDWIYSSPAIDSDGTIYVGSYDGYLYVINPDGSLKWKYETGRVYYSSPAIGDDGTIYVGTDDGYLYAIQGESEGLADEPWPKFGKNNRNTGNYADSE
jgi:outer membrane protein assembly factor BamB